MASEGAADDQFLPRLLTRALTELCLTDFDEPVEVAEVQILRKRAGPAPLEDVITLVDQNPMSFSIVFFHRDQGARPDRAFVQWLEPLRAKWGDRAEQLVRVVPVRETEAWLLADGAALRRALGVKWSDAEMGLPASPGEVERVGDPKRVLTDLMRRVSRSTHDHFAQLGELVSLDRLRHVPAYQRWRDEARDALTRLGYRRA